MATKVLKHTSNSSYTKEVIKVMQKGTAPHIRKNYLFRHAVDANVIHRMKFFQIYFAPYKFDYKLKETRLKIICDFDFSCFFASFDERPESTGFDDNFWLRTGQISPKNQK